ncbi:MAG TPA: imidazole glycerol phosphate synthase subunit HisH [Steroidobacteraceae bacterium]|jgi:glutamine amidotransferase|nr:imidazole glycerol phosphate synthase subunit HisH [Steroidobacteraceae bacterium]
MNTPVDVAIIDSGGANLASLQYALARLGARSFVSADPAAISAAPRVLLPGVGAAADAMQRLRACGLDRLIPQLQVPLLGICLGMQLLFEHSAEADTPCLGVLPGRIEQLSPGPGMPVPHMGWNTLEPTGADPLLSGIDPGAYVYFVHSYAAAPGPHTLALVQYGKPLAAVVRRANFCGVQFHPERSAAVGARVLRNFLAL